MAPRPDWDGGVPAPKLSAALARRARKSPRRNPPELRVAPIIRKGDGIVVRYAPSGAPWLPFSHESAAAFVMAARPSGLLRKLFFAVNHEVGFGNGRRCARLPSADRQRVGSGGNQDSGILRNVAE